MGAYPAALSVAGGGWAGGRHPWLFVGMIVLRWAFGLLVGWSLTPPATIAAPSPVSVPERQAEEAPLAIKELFFPEDREKDLARKVQDHLRSPLERGLGLDLIMELGAMQIRERKLDEADAFFKELNRPERRIIQQYRTLAELGQAMVLAFRDQPYASNRIFVETLEQVQKKETPPAVGAGKGSEPKKGFSKVLYGDFFRQNAAWHEQMAHAINRNFVNAPDSFPTNARLQEYRKSPISAGKSTPPMP